MDHVREVLDAAQNGDLEAIRQYIAANSINVVDEEGSTPLMYAAANDKESVVRVLLGSGVDVDQQNLYGWTALLQASCYGHHEVVYTLLQHHANINLCNSWVTTPLVAAAQGGFSTVVQVLLEKGAEVMSGDEVLSPTPLMVAAQCGHESIVSQLLSHGSNVNARLQAIGWTPLMLAARNNHLGVVQVLLRHGGMREMRDVNNKRAIDIASSLGHKSIVNHLSEDLSVTSSDVDIFEAAKQGDVNMLHEALTKHKASFNVVDKEGATPLIYAARKGHLSVCRALLEAGADVDAQDHAYGWTAFMHSTHHRHHEVAKLLSQHGANVTVRAKNGSSAFDIANHLGDSQMIHLIAMVTIQRLNQQKNSGSEAKSTTVMPPLMEEEEHNKEAVTQSPVPPDANHEVDSSPHPVPVEVILRRLSNAYQTPEPPNMFLQKEHHDKRGFLSPGMLSPVPPGSTSSSPEPNDTILPAITVPFSPNEPPPTSPNVPSTAHTPSGHPPLNRVTSPSTPQNQNPLPLLHEERKLTSNLPSDVESRKSSGEPVRKLKTPKRALEMRIPQLSDHAGSIGHLGILSPQAKSPKSPRSMPEDPFRNMLRQHSQQKLMFRTPLLKKDETNKSRVLPSKSRIVLPPHGKNNFKNPLSRNIDDGNKRSILPRQRGISEPLLKKPSFEKLKLTSSPRKGPDLKAVLAEASLSHHYYLFEQQEMDLELFLTLSEEDLIEVGVSDPNDRGSLLALIARLKRSTPLRSPTRTFDRSNTHL